MCRNCDAQNEQLAQANENVKAAYVAACDILTSLCKDENERWWRDVDTGAYLERNVGELLMLCVSELAEAMEGHRKNINDDKLTHRSMLEVELADCLIRIYDLAGHLGLDLGGALVEKIEYNRERVDHTHEARRQAGGKKF